MSEQKTSKPDKQPSDLVRPLAMQSLDTAVLKWRNLIERRRAHFIDLYLSGRWKHFYSEEQFLTRFRDAMSVADRWSEIAPMPSDAAQQVADQPAAE